MNRLHIAEPKKRDEKERVPVIPESVLRGAKKEGPTVKELEEEFGGAGNFYIPIEEHYILEEEDWKYDKWPEFFKGKNVLDFYDPEIEEKLKKLEEEEEMLEKMEDDEAEMSENSDGVTETELKAALQEVRSKTAAFKHEHDMKKKRRAKSKIKKLSQMKRDLAEKGIDVNTESLKTRAKKRRSLGDLEKAAESDSDEDMIDEEERGRPKRKEDKAKESAASTKADSRGRSV